MNVLDYIERERSFYDNRTINFPGNEAYSQSKLIRAVNAARLSKYIDPAQDDIIGDYPDDNISKYRIRLEARSIDFDTKHIELAPETAQQEDRVSNMIATKALWIEMRRINFGATLNKICDVRPEFGGVLVKKVGDSRPSP